MTELQEGILDRLMGTPVGVNWPDGPLTIAADVIGGLNPVRFGQTDNDRGAKGEIARRLGYPILLCEAIQGANRGVNSEDDRRRLAMTLFRTLPIDGRIPRMSSDFQNRIALCLAIRTHPYVCRRRDCPVPRVLADLLRAPTITRKMAVAASRERCAIADRSLRETVIYWLTARSTTVERLVQSAAMALRGFETGKSVHGWCSLRESARLAASERGVEEAIACCLEIARQCRMAL
jgi:hypothetical protein